ncbi:hypothetical protein K1719_010959 [Acacia pycnantha]|nr:hypothetical protein K1719_010959 [Acacia pycnantha]
MNRGLNRERIPYIFDCDGCREADNKMGGVRRTKEIRRKRQEWGHEQYKRRTLFLGFWFGLNFEQGNRRKVHIYGLSAVKVIGDGWPKFKCIL